MHPRQPAHSPAEVATEVNGILVGLGILTMALAPFALPGLLLGLLLLLPLAPLALVLVPLLLFRARRGGLRRRASRAVEPLHGHRMMAGASD